MNRRFYAALLFLSLGAGCSTSGTLEGTLQPKMGAVLSSDLKLIARAKGAADMACQATESPVQADGRFSLKSLCADTTYELKLSASGLLLEGTATVQGGPQEAPRDIAVWPVPAGEGVAVLQANGKVVQVSGDNDVRSAKMMESGRTVLYPRYKPSGAIHVDDGHHLILSGEKTLSRLSFTPLVESTAEREFESVNIGPHWYVGVRFLSNTEVEEVTATLDATRVTEVQGMDGRKVKYIAHDALAPGHYALMGADDPRMFVVTFGPFSKEAAASN